MCEKVVRSKATKPYDMDAMLTKSKDVEKISCILTLAERDYLLEKKWKEFEDVPMNPETERIEQAFLHFPAGTWRFDIWRWFDERHSKGVRYLLYNEETDSLLEFIKNEVPFRLKEILQFPEEKITDNIIQACIKTLDDDNGIMFDYDSIDRALEDTCNELGLYKEDDDDETE